MSRTVSTTAARACASSVGTRLPSSVHANVTWRWRSPAISRSAARTTSSFACCRWLSVRFKVELIVQRAERGDPGFDGHLGVERSLGER
jgi:hypothetical protein